MRHSLPPESLWDEGVAHNDVFQEESQYDVKAVDDILIAAMGNFPMIS